MKERYKNTHYEAIHSAAQGLYKAGAMNDAEMREFDEACLVQPTATVSHTQKIADTTARSGPPVYARGT